MAEAPKKSDNHGNSSAKHSRTIAHCKCEHRLIARHATCPSSKCECALRLSNIHTRQEVIERTVLLIATYKKYTMPLLKRPHKVTMYEFAVSASARGRSQNLLLCNRKNKRQQ